jgi:hypothetical protein
VTESDPPERPVPDGSGRDPGPPRRWLIVVAEDEPILRQGLRRSFANDPSVEVVLDGRRAESSPPRGRGGTAAPERRRPLSPEQSVVWRDLKFLLVDRWKGMAVYEASSAAEEPPR